MNANSVEQVEANNNADVLPQKPATKSSKAELSSRPDSDGNTLCNVHYSGYDAPTAPRFVDCRLENVHFINCKFRDTEFRNLKLAIVAFINIDLQNVTISDVELKRLAWKDTLDRNVVLVQRSTQKDVEHQVTCLGPYRPISGEHLTHTVIETRRFEQQSPMIDVRLWRHERSFRHSLHIGEVPRPRLLDRLMDHQGIMSRITDNLTHMLDDDQVYSRRIYRKKDDYESSFRQIFSCVITFQDQVPTSPSMNPDTVSLYCPKTTGPWHLATLALLHTNRNGNDPSTDYCQGPLRRAQCHVSTVDCHFGLRNKIVHLESAKTVVLHYNLEGDQGFLKTNDETWHRLMVYIRHKASYIPEIHLIIDKCFWDLAVWRNGATAVLGQNDLRNSPNPRDFPNFLTKIAKIAAPADRWVRHDLKHATIHDADNHSNHGTRLHLSIDGTVTAEQRDFVKKLAKKIEVIRIERPLFHWRWHERYTRAETDWWHYSRHAR